MKDPFDLTGKAAVITGSSRGIGRAIAEAMAARGAKVVITSRKAEACAATAAAINAAYPGAAISLPANIASKDDLQAMADQARDRLGSIDILVCNAATNPYYGPMAGISDDQFRKVIDNNVLSSHWLAQMVSKGMMERKDGVILFVSSIGAFRGSPVIGTYNLSKAADILLAKNLAIEFGRHNIRVNCIAPGLIRTDFSRALWESPEILRDSLSNTPLGRIGEPEDIAGAAVFLASQAGRYITGQTIVIDGGVTITMPGF